MAGLSILTSSVGLVLVGHGSEFGSYKETVEELAAIIRNRSHFKTVQVGFMEITSPTIHDALSTAIKDGAQKIVVVPVLLAESRHTMQDIPKLLGLESGQTHCRISLESGSSADLAYCKPIGPDQRLAEIILDRATAAFSDLGPRASSSSTNQAGKEIFEESMKIIRELLAEDFAKMNPRIVPIVARVVHATADPEFSRLLLFSQNAVESGLEAVRKGADIVTDVKMVRSGINSQTFREFGGKIRTYTDDERTIGLADKMKITRTAAAMQIAAEDGLDGDIVVIGNSPTAAFAIADIVERRLAKPALVVATPVGFVKATESKDKVSTLAVPYIVTRGVKGGSAVAVAIMNGLLTLIQ